MWRNKLRNSWKSLTIWVNGVALAAIPVIEYAHANVTELRDYLGDNIYKPLGLALVVANLALRFKTTKDLADK